MVYTLMPQLKEMGLIKEIKIGAKTYFEASDPDLLKDLLKQSSNKIRELIPELKSHQATASAIPLVTIYENPIAMREWYKNFMRQAKKGEEFLVWSAGKDWYNLDRKFYNKFLLRKEKLNMINLVLAEDKKESHDIKKTIGPQGKVKWKFFKKGWKTNTEMWIWRDQICYLTIRENATNMIVIQSADLVALERFNFYQVWNSLK